MDTARLTLLEPPCAPQPPDARSILIETTGSFPVVQSHERTHSIRSVTPADTALLADLIARLRITRGIYASSGRYHMRN